MSGAWDASRTEFVSPQTSADNSADSEEPAVFPLPVNVSNDNLAANSSSNSSTDDANTTPSLPPALYDLTAEDWQVYQPETLEEGNVDAEIAEINRFCIHIENNLAQIGLGRVGTASTPRVITARLNRRAYTPSDSVDLIDLSNHELVPRSARSREPVAIIDLCTPVASGRVPSYIDLDDSYERPTCHHNRKHGAPESSSSHTKRVRVDNNNSSTESLYKCPVCLDSVRLREPSSTRCGHVFCKACIEAAIQSTHKCPLCNKKLTLRQVFRIYL